jgi:hypothetical protein
MDLRGSFSAERQANFEMEFVLLASRSENKGSQAAPVTVTMVTAEKS